VLFEQPDTQSIPHQQKDGLDAHDRDTTWYVVGFMARHRQPADFILLAFAQGQAMISSGETVPFRLTPNMQHFITRVGIEGVVSGCATALSKCLTSPEFDLGGTLSLFIRDEVSVGLFLL
jgi:hypothetical protein